MQKKPQVSTKMISRATMVSPFVGRLDDRGEDGMDLVRNVKKMYERGDGHVHVLAASIRSLNHLLCSFARSAELAAVPRKVLEEWAAKGFPCQMRISGTKGSMRVASH
jgi:transaldolase